MVWRLGVSATSNWNIFLRIIFDCWKQTTCSIWNPLKNQQNTQTLRFLRKVDLSQHSNRWVFEAPRFSDVLRTPRHPVIAAMLRWGCYPRSLFRDRMSRRCAQHQQESGKFCQYFMISWINPYQTYQGLFKGNLQEPLVFNLLGALQVSATD